MTRQQRRSAERNAKKGSINVISGNFDNLRPSKENEEIGNIQLRMFEGIESNSNKMNTSKEENMRIITFLGEAFNMIYHTPGMGIREAKQLERDFPLEVVTKLLRG